MRPTIVVLSPVVATKDPSVPNYSAPAAACAGEILRLLKDRPYPLSLTDIQRWLDRTKSLSFRVLRELESQEFVKRDGHGNYRLGIEAFEVGAAYLSQFDFIEVTRRIVQELAEEAGETVNLGVLRRGDVIYLMKYIGHSSFVTISRVGGTVPASCVAVGKALLSQLPKGELASVTAGHLMQMTPNSITSLEELERDLEKTRIRGYAIDREEAVLGRCGLAVTVEGFDTENGLAAVSLSTAAHLFEERQERLLELLLAAKRRIDREAATRESMNQFDTIGAAGKGLAG